MILRGDLHFIGGKVFHRLICTPVAEFDFVCFCSHGKAHKLHAKAYAEHRFVTQQSFYGFNSLSYRFRVSRAVGEKNTVRPKSFYGICRR